MQRSTLIVVEPSPTQDLCTLEDVRAYFNIPGVDTSQDARLQTLITFSSLVIADLCDRVFGLETVSEHIVVDVNSLEATGGVLLNRYPVREVLSVSVDSGSPDYVLDGDAGVIHGALLGDVDVTYTGGYVLPEDAPRALSLAALDVIRQSYYLGSRDPMIQSITDNASGSIRFFPMPGVGSGRGSGGGIGAGRAAAPLSPQATALIHPYRRIALA